MPELPEVEVVRRGLAEAVVGERIRSVEVGRARSVRRHADPAELVGRVAGRRVLDVGRRGKFLLLGLDGGDVVVVHLGMSGRLLAAHRRDPLAPHTHVVLALAGGRQVRFVDPRTFGQVFVTGADATGAVPALAHLGVDPLEDALTPGGLGRIVATRRTRLKPLLMDQRAIAGIGNIYSDEILWGARLRGDRPGSTLDDDDLGRLHRVMGETLAEAVACGGSSLADAQYVDFRGRPGRYQGRHRVYGREGAPCPRCGTPVARARTAGRSAFSCPGCQS